MNEKEIINVGDDVFILVLNKIIKLRVVQIITTKKYINVGDWGPEPRLNEDVQYILQSEKDAKYNILSRGKEFFTKDVIFKTKQALVDSLIQ